jgi:thymidylate synthase
MYGIISATKDFGVGKDNALLVKSKADMQHFKTVTTGNLFGKVKSSDDIRNTVIMGRKTFESIGRSLPNRHNIVISTEMKPVDGVHIFGSIDDCLVGLTKKPFNSGQIFVISCFLIEQFIKRNLLAGVLLTHFKSEKVEADTYIDAKLFQSSPNWKCTTRIDNAALTRFYTEPKVNWDQKYTSPQDKHLYNLYKSLLQEANNKLICLSVEHWQFVNLDEQKILTLFKEIMSTPDSTPNRTGVNTKSIFGYDQVIDISSGILPLSTVRKMPAKFVFEELMWMLRGSTDATELMEKNIHIWDGNTTREYLDKVGLKHYKVGDIGPTYGFSMRHYGAEYKGCEQNYNGQGYDQLREVVRLIKEDPVSRRIIINLWNPASLKECALPPCAFCYQFSVNIHTKTLSCKLTQRSSDVILAGMWNMVTATLLTRILAHFTGLKPGKIIWSVGDIHIYENQWEAVDEICARVPRPFPLLRINALSSEYDTVDDIVAKILELKYEDLDILNYHPHPSVKLVMN